MIDRCAVVIGLPIDDVTIGEAVDRIAAMVEVGPGDRAHPPGRDGQRRLCRQRRQRRRDAPDPAAQRPGHPRRDARRVGSPPPRHAAARADARRRSPAGAGEAVGRSRLPDLPVRRRARRRRERCGLAHASAFRAPWSPVSTRPTLHPTARWIRPLSSRSAPCVLTSSASPSATRSRSAGSPATARPLGAPVLIGIGGTLDFLTGVTRRAPSWMQRAGLEWLHRAVSEPRRLAGRYARDLVVFLPGLLEPGMARPSSLVRDPAGGHSGRLDHDDSRPRSAARRPGRPPRARTRSPPTGSLTVDLSALTSLDNPTVAALAGLLRRARRAGTSVSLVGLTPELDASARRLNVRGLLEGRDPAEFALIPDANEKGKPVACPPVAASRARDLSGIPTSRACGRR